MLIDLTPKEEGPSQALGLPERGGELLRATDLPELADELRPAPPDTVDWSGSRLGGDDGDAGDLMAALIGSTSC